MVAMRFPLFGRALAAVALGLASVAASNARSLVPGEWDIDPAVVNPASWLGFELGEWHLRNDQINGYLQALAASSPRVALQEIGRTHQGLPLTVAIITAPENHARLEELRLQHLDSLSPDRPLVQGPLVVNLGYSIHGNEPSGANAAPAIAHLLAAARDPWVEELLANTIILLEPVRNPDGLDRFASWVNNHRGKALVADRINREHNEAWPRSRSNHYWFDLNRDWLPLVHPESRARIELFHHWRPHLLTDHHEMGTDSTFFFQPGIPTRNNPSIDPGVVDLTAKLAEFHAEALDQLGELYFTRERFDDYYIGKGSTYPDLHGTVGILFEQASSRGHIQQSEHGPLDFATTIRNQIAVSISSLRGAHALRDDFRAIPRRSQSAAAELAESMPAGWVIDLVQDPVRSWLLLDLLQRHRIRVHALTAPLEANGRAWQPGEAILVPSNQPQRRLIREMFVRRVEFEDASFYDISSWNILLAHGLAHAELDSLSPSLIGHVILATPPPAGKTVGPRQAYAYAFAWTGHFAPRALHRLQQAGVLVKAATRAFSSQVNGERIRFAEGTILVPAAMQSNRRLAIEQIIEEIAREDGITVYGLATGLSAEGADLGSGDFITLSAPKVLLVTGEGVNSTAAGEVWHLLDAAMGIPVALVDANALGGAKLADYTAIIMVDGTYRSVSAAAIESLQTWVNQGGTLLALGRAVRWAQSSKLATVEFTELEADEESTRLPYGEASQIESLKRIAGAIFSIDADVTHPLAYGLGSDRVALMKTNRLALKPSKSPYSTPLIYDSRPLLSGYASEANLNALAGAAAAVVHHSGRGRVVLMVDNPVFRGMWHGSSKLLLNGVLLGGAIRTPPEPTESEAEH
jgi:hypothetical protein